MPHGPRPPSGLRRWWREFSREAWPTALRSALFLACLTALLGAAGHLDWLDVLALKVLPADRLERRSQPPGQRYRTVVLELAPEFFETELAGRTPVDRERFAALLRDVATSWPRASVLAVDYDLSPSGRPPPGELDRSALARVARVEAEGQERLDALLARGLRPPGAAPLAVVLIAPLPAPPDAALARREWQERMIGAGVRFGDPALLVHEGLGVVVKHLAVPAAREPCDAGGDVARPFAAVVNDAAACAARAPLRLASAAAPPSRAAARAHTRSGAVQGTPELLDLGGARRSVFICPVWEPEDAGEGCRARLLAGGSRPDDVEAVFLGAGYGQDDRFRTAVGDQYGVALHAFAAHSLRSPVRRLVPFSFLVDVALGVLSSTVFGLLWGAAARSAPQSGRRFACIAAVFAVLGLLAAAAAWVTPWMLDRGTWLNPLLVLAGFFVDSYGGAAERVALRDAERVRRAGGGTGGEGEAEASGRARWRRWLGDLVGTSREGEAVLAWAELRRLRPEALFQAAKKLLFYWAVVGCGLWVVAAA